MTRLKYSEVGNLLYTDWFTLGPNFIVRGIINLTTHTFQIIEFNTDVVYDGQARSLRESKAKLKSQLITAGVNFTDEIRKST